MRSWRLAAAALLGLLVAAPLAFLFAELVDPSIWSTAGTELDRQVLLAKNTSLLVGGTLALAIPAGVAAAVLFYRTDLPFRGFFRFLTFLTLFIPLPVLATAWQAALGTGGLLPMTLWRDGAGQPWASGMLPAVWTHAAAALPWVVLIVGQGLRWVERELEEDALLSTGPWGVLWAVTLPRCRAMIGAAALFVALLTASEITVTDRMQVRTFAEEVYLEFWFGGGGAGRATLAALPIVLATLLLFLWLLPRLDHALPPLDRLTLEPRLLPLGRWRRPCLLLVLAAMCVLAGVPLMSLVWKAGLHGNPRVWSVGSTLASIASAAGAEGGTLLRSLTFSLLSGGLTVGVALVLCWLAIESRMFRALALGLAAVLWALPAPLIGVGLKESILALANWSPQGPLAQQLHHGPSPLPVLWANLLRFLPCALALLWPVVRMLPRELRDSARVDGARPLEEFVLVVWPLTHRAALWAALVLAALALGEVGAVAARVETPGWETYAHVLFNRMHYGTQNDVAGMCLLLVLADAGVGSLVGVVGFLRRRSYPPS